MATCGEVLSQTFPNMDPELASYITGILADDSELETETDVFDAIGDFLLEADNTQTEQTIRQICSQLYLLLTGSLTSPVLNNKILSAPLCIGQLDRTESDDAGSIWLVKERSGVQTVNQKKLQKAELMLQKKLDKRENVPTQINGLTLDEATACQQINKRDAKFDQSGNNKSYDIKIENFDVAYGDRSLVTGAELHLIAGRRYGFIGRNGLGKTTVLRMLSQGGLRIPSHIRILHVEQEVEGDDTLALQSVLQADERREHLLRRERELHSQTSESQASAAELTQIYQDLESMESDKAPARAAMVLSGLGFSQVMQETETRKFSGGWRMRLALARALFSIPDLLLLDEPTNMLDMKAILWLEKYLSNWPKTLIVVSHDRQFLNSVTTDILHLHDKTIDSYHGNYEDFYKTREERQKNQQREYDAQKQYREHAQVFIDKFRYNAKRASLVQSKLKLLDKLPELKPVEKESEVVLKFCECDKLSPPILQLDEVCFYYSKDKPIFRNICVNANMQSRICIVGDNGAGKTTLLKLLLGNLDPVSGIRDCHRNLRLGYFSQHHVDQLDMNVSSIELLASRFPGLTNEVYRSKLGAFGVSGELATRPVVTLSGGQKSRVAFSLLNMACPNFLVLDEPTNHLDMETIEALGVALNRFQGGVILVSHDERLITSICTELWVVGDGQVITLDGGFEKYREHVDKQILLQL